MRCAVIETVENLAGCLGEWDALSVELERPFCAPAWLLAWWRHVAPAEAELRVLVAHDGDEMVGVAPWYVEDAGRRRGRYRPLGSDTCARVEPLCRPGREEEVAGAFAEALARAQPRPALLTFEGIDSRSPWPELMRGGWPAGRRPWVGRMRSDAAPTIDLESRDFEEWFKSKTSHFRQRMRRSRKDFEAAGGSYRLSDRADLESDIEALARLHKERWAHRGGTGAFRDGVEGMLADAGRELVDSGRFRLWSLQLDDETISSHLLIVAGSEFGYWLTGFDADHAKISPARLGILNSVKDAATQGAERVDLGEGHSPYKYRFADGEDRLDWLWLVPPGGTAPMVRAGLLPRRLRRVASERMPSGMKARMNRVLRRR
jgi:CelD/BcsL family acetyltransferase involved in cellulose biosynthesis